MADPVHKLLFRKAQLFISAQYFDYSPLSPSLSIESGKSWDTYSGWGSLRSSPALRWLQPVDSIFFTRITRSLINLCLNRYSLSLFLYFVYQLVPLLPVVYPKCVIVFISNWLSDSLSFKAVIDKCWCYYAVIRYKTHKIRTLGNRSACPFHTWTTIKLDFQYVMWSRKTI